jgi:DNA helicase-2/ATP-dependent DNA helicase PcrA
MALLDDLNPQQREAVVATEGPVLVLAGAGTGKTRVVTYRLVYLIEQGAPGESILAVTFTNKAADQMKQRVAALLARAGLANDKPWISTFHSFCARLLRREAPQASLARDFAIYDEDDQIAAVKLALRQLGQDERSYTAKGLLERISHAKNHEVTLEVLADQAGDEQERFVAEVWRAYQTFLRQAGALDFDDLLLRAVELLTEHAEIRARWSERFRYIEVDEFQDTNRGQYELLRLLAGGRKNLCVVGDEDQSIYAWRGADVGNILRFTEDFPGAQVLRLEENYRSTQIILDAAGAVVGKNVHRLGKTLRGTRGAGSNLKYFEASDAVSEARFAAEEIARLLAQDPRLHIAVLYRTNFQSRAFEEALRRLGVGYRVVGGFSFYRRAEVKDTLAYARLAMNPQDDVALLRVLNVPPRGIGEKTIESLQALAAARKVSLWEAVPILIESGRKGAAGRGLPEFRAVIEGLRGEVARLGAVEFLKHLLRETGYIEYLERQESVEGSSRLENIRELTTAAAEASEQGEPLAEFLDRAALVSDADEYDERARVSLMTLHGAKGLEFDHVFLAGLEEGLFPHSRSLTSPEELEEERRLCYVGMTRAKKTLTLTRATYRRSPAAVRLVTSAPSRFLLEIPGELIEAVAGSLAEPGQTRRYEPLEAAEGSQALLGLRVRHPRYGVGTIIQVDGEGPNRKLTVSFLDHGTKKLLERYALLEPA